MSEQPTTFLSVLTACIVATNSCCDLIPQYSLQHSLLPSLPIHPKLE